MADTGIQAMQPVNLARMDDPRDINDLNTSIAQNENALNQNFLIIFNKLLDLEATISST